MKPRNFNEEDVVLWHEYTKLMKGVVEKLNQTYSDSHVSYALRTMHKRIMASMDSLLLLHAHSQHIYDYDASVILRGMYDTMLQSLYVLNNPDERARLYHEYRWVEKYNWMIKFDKNSTRFAVAISASEKRDSGEEEIRNNYQRVYGMFQGKNGKVRNRWYPGSLRDVAIDVGYEEEYDLLQSMLSSIVHSTPFAIMGDSFIKGPVASLMAAHFTMRYLGSVGKFQGVMFEEAECSIIGDSNKNWFDLFVMKE